MTASDVQMVDLAKGANLLNKVPSQSAKSVAPQQRKAGLYRNGLKRALDTGLIMISLPVVVPLVGFLALCVALTGGQPFYSQRRVGHRGKIYKIWKLRSMVKNADAVLEQHLASDPALRAEWDSKQKLMNDPRITPLGAILRKCSIDELPQLWNVLRGEMSLVGPRPMMISQKPLYPGEDYYKLRPGITGLWQVSDRNESTFAARAKFDAEYNKTLSFKTDLSILARTVRVVLRGTGH